MLHFVTQNQIFSCGIVLFRGVNSFPKKSNRFTPHCTFKSNQAKGKLNRRVQEMRCYLWGTRRARRRPWLSRTSAAPAAAAEGMVPCVVSRRPRWMRSPHPPLPPEPPPPPPLPPLGKDTAATAAPFAARRLDLIRSSLAPPEQKHHPEASLRTPIRRPRLPSPDTAAGTCSGKRRRATDGDAERLARVDSFWFRAEGRKGTGLPGVVASNTERDTVCSRQCPV